MVRTCNFPLESVIHLFLQRAAPQAAQEAGHVHSKTDKKLACSSMVHAAQLLTVTGHHRLGPGEDETV